MKKRSVLYTWGIEFSLMLVLVIVMCIALTSTARSRLLDEYEQFTALQQEKMEDSLDNYFTMLRNQTVELLTDNTVESFAYLSAPSQPDNYDLYLIQNRLLSAVGNDIADHIYIYFQNIRRAITDETILEPAECTEKLLGAAGKEHMERFFSLVGNVDPNWLQVVGSGDDTKVIAVTAVPLVGRVSRAAIIQVVSPERLKEILEMQSSLEQATTLLMDEKNRIVCHTGDDELAEQIAASYNVLDNARRFESDSRKYWVYQKQLDSTGWILVTAAPMEIIENRSNWAWQMMLVFLLGFALVWVLMTAVFMRWNYRPLQKLKKRADFSPDSSGNEYDQLDFAFQTVQNDLENLKLLQKNQRKVLRQEWLGNAIAYDIPLNRSVSEGFVPAKLVGNDEGYWQLVLLPQNEPLDALEALFEQQEQDCYAVLTNARGRQVFCLIGSEKAALDSFSKTVQQTLQQNGVAYLCGELHQGFTGLHDEFVSLCEQAERPVSGSERSHGSLRLSLTSSEEIPQLVFSGKGEEACALLARSAQSNLTDQSGSVYLARMYYNNFLLHLLNEVPEGPLCIEVQHAILSTSRALYSALDQPSLQELVDTLLIAVSGKYQPILNEGQPELIDRCIVCVREHFREHDFNVSRMADILGVSVPYLSKYFKEHAGVNLLGYLNSVRIDYAKKLIAEEKLTVAAAADRAGFENINTFIRLFKKYVGDTPGNYSKQ